MATQQHKFSAARFSGLPTQQHRWPLPLPLSASERRPQPLDLPWRRGLGAHSSSIRISVSIRAQRLRCRCPFSFIEFFTLTTFRPEAQLFTLFASAFVSACAFTRISYLFLLLC